MLSTSIVVFLITVSSLRRSRHGMVIFGNPWTSSTDFEKEHFFPTFVSWQCVETYSVLTQDHGRFYFPVDCHEWRGLETHCALHVPTSPVFSYFSSWVFERSFLHLVFTVARSTLAVSVVVQLLQVTTDKLLGSFASTIEFI